MKRIYAKSGGTFLLVVMVGVIFLAVSAAPAQACSCGGFSDLGQGIERSEAAFVGKLVDKRGAGDGESIYGFEVEEWVKGLTADLKTGEHDRLTTMPAQSVGPLVILEDARP